MEVVPKIPVLTDYEMDQWSGSWDQPWFGRLGLNTPRMGV